MSKAYQWRLLGVWVICTDPLTQQQDYCPHNLSWRCLVLGKSFSTRKSISGGGHILFLPMLANTFFVAPFVLEGKIFVLSIKFKSEETIAIIGS